MKAQSKSSDAHLYTFEYPKYLEIFTFREEEAWLSFSSKGKFQSYLVDFMTIFLILLSIACTHFSYMNREPRSGKAFNNFFSSALSSSVPRLNCVLLYDTHVNCSTIYLCIFSALISKFWPFLSFSFLVYLLSSLLLPAHPISSQAHKLTSSQPYNGFRISSPPQIHRLHHGARGDSRRNPCEYTETPC